MTLAKYRLEAFLRRATPFAQLCTRTRSNSISIIRGGRGRRTVCPRAANAAYASFSSSRQLLHTLIRAGVAAAGRVFLLLRPLGRTNLFIVVLGFLGAAVATIRLKIVASVRSCRACMGYGIGRCPLCSGKGIVGWEGKWNHQEPCPSCLGRRYVECHSCGGRFHRPLFQHICTTSDTLIRELESTRVTLGSSLVPE